MSIKVSNFNFSLYSGLTFYGDKDILTQKDLVYTGNKTGLTIAGGLPLGNIGLLDLTYNLEATFAGGEDFISNPDGLVDNSHLSWGTDLSCAPYFFLDQKKTTALGPIFGIGYEQAFQKNLATYYYDTDADGYIDSYQDAWKIAYSKEPVFSGGIGFKTEQLDIKTTYAYYLFTPPSSRILLDVQWRNEVFSPALTIGARQDFSKLSNLKLRGTFPIPFFIQYEYQKFAEKAVPGTHTVSLGYEFKL